MDVINDTFLQVIVICLLRDTAFLNKRPVENERGGEPADGPEGDSDFPGKGATKRSKSAMKSPITGLSRVKRVMGTATKTRRDAGKSEREVVANVVIPTFIAGYHNGIPIRKPVRVYTEEQVQALLHTGGEKEQMSECFGESKPSTGRTNVPTGGDGPHYSECSD